MTPIKENYPGEIRAAAPTKAYGTSPLPGPRSPFYPLAKAEPLVPLTIQLDWIANAQFAGLLVAKEEGWYAQQGLDVTIEPVNQTTLDTVTIGAVLFLSLVPIPAAPWRYLPYLFAGLVLIGTLGSGYFRSRSPPPNAS
jgi:hypothetical protein